MGLLKVDPTSRSGASQVTVKPGIWLGCSLALLAALAGMSDSNAAAPPPVVVLRLDGAIGPATAQHVARSLERAAHEHAQLVVLQMDTPGGLDTSMRTIIKDILASPTPVAVFVAPQGARAASAGTYILYAAHVAAMAPATNLGAATPIEIGMPMPGAGPEPPGRAGSAASAAASSHDAKAAKRVNDAAAYIRSLAQLRGRDTAWAEQAVRESVSLPASDALSRKVIDIVAVDLNDLLRQLDGRVIAMGETGAAQRDAGHGERRRRHAGARLARAPPRRHQRPQPGAHAADARRLRPAVRVHESGLRGCPA